MHAASLERSPRLQSVLLVLQDGKAHSTREIIDRTGSCAINSIVSELRANGIAIDCQYESTTTDGADVYVYKLTPNAPMAAANQVQDTAVHRAPDRAPVAPGAVVGLRQATCACPACGSWYRRGAVCSRCGRDCGDDPGEK
jgi:hypothetical protein